MPSFPKVNQSGSRPQQSSARPTRALSSSRPAAPIGGGLVDWCSGAEQSDSVKLEQLKLTFTDGRESQAERCRRVLASVGNRVHRASEFTFTPQAAREASERAMGEGAQNETRGQKPAGPW